MSLFQHFLRFFRRISGQISKTSLCPIRLLVEPLENRSVPSAVTHDVLGNTYVTGCFSGQRDFGSAAVPAVLKSSGAADVFVAKYDPSGALVWAKDLAGSSRASSVGNGITLDNAGNVILTGGFQGSVDFNPGASIYRLTAAGGTDAFVAKLTGDGDLLWAVRAGSASDDVGNDVVTDASGNIWAAGSFQRSANFDPAGSSAGKLTSFGSYDAFLWKLNAGGQYQSGYQLGGKGNEKGNSVAIDGTGNVYVTGCFTGTADFDPGAGTKNLASRGNADVYVAKLTNSGTLAWATSIGGSYDDKGAQITVDAAGNVYTAGTFKGTVDFDPSSGTCKLTCAGNADVYLLKLNASGSFIWARQFGGTADDLSQGLALDPAGNAVVTGTFQGSASFSPTLRLNSPGKQDIFVAAVDSQGRTVWARTAGGVAADPATGGTEGGSTVTTPLPSSLNPTLPPSGNFDLSNWYLTLPTGSSGHPNTVSTSKLTAGYTSQYFYTGADGAMVFWTPVTGVTTSGSSYPRSELRETKPDGSLYNWSVTAGTAALNATLAVNQVPSTGKVIIGQIHDDGTGGIKSEPLLKLIYKYDSTAGTGSIVAEVRPTPSSTTNKSFTLATNVKLNTQFSYLIQLKADLTLSVQINGVTKYSAPIDSSWKTQGMYFKAGSYVQDNVGSSTEGGRVSFYALTPSHT